MRIKSLFMGYRCDILHLRVYKGGGHTLEWYLYGDRNSPGNYRTLIGHKSDITYPITSEKSSVTSFQLFLVKIINLVTQLRSQINLDTSLLTW